MDLDNEFPEVNATFIHTAVNMKDTQLPHTERLISFLIKKQEGEYLNVMNRVINLDVAHIHSINYYCHLQGMSVIVIKIILLLICSLKVY